MLEYSSFSSVFEIHELLQQIVIATAIGGLIGLEREIGEDESNKFAGLRTLALLCGAGPLIVYYAEIAELPIFVGFYLALGLLLALSIAQIRFRLAEEDVGFTTTVTVFLVTLFGVLIGYGQYFEAVSAAIITAFILAEKRQMFRYVNNLNYQELTDTMKLGALVFILYPILPAEPIDPYSVIILRDVLVFAIFVLLIEFAAYVSMRQFGGSRGLEVTGLLAGMANSFATAAVMARMANKSERALDPASSGIMLSVASMIVRNVGIATVLALGIFTVLWMPLVGMLIVTMLIIGYLLREGSRHDDLDMSIDSPFSFKSAVKFSFIYIAITVVSVLSQQYFGEAGLLATAYAGGLVSSAAVAVSAATVYNSGAVGVNAAGGMVILSILASLTSKIVLIETINGEMRNKAVLPMAIIGIIGVLIYALQGLL